MKLPKEAHDFFSKGGICPNCLRYGKIYRRDVNAGMIGILKFLKQVTIDINPDRGWLRITEYMKDFKENFRTQEYSKLRYWNLLERHQHDFTGMWRVSEFGNLFLDGEAKIPKSVYIFDCQLVGVSGETLGINDILGKDIQYGEKQ